jgi:hypothetical protein
MADSGNVVLDTEKATEYIQSRIRKDTGRFIEKGLIEMILDYETRYMQLEGIAEIGGQTFICGELIEI